MFRVASMGEMFQKKIDELFSGMPNVFTIADDIIIVGFDELGRDNGHNTRQGAKNM